MELSLLSCPTELQFTILTGLSSTYLIALKHSDITLTLHFVQKDIFYCITDWTLIFLVNKKKKDKMKNLSNLLICMVVYVGISPIM